MERNYDLIVIGGGIGGLTLAHFAVRAGWRTLLLERGPRAGGCLATFTTPDGFWLELGAHTLFNSYGPLLGVLDDLRLTPRLATRRRLPFRLWADGAIKAIPAALDLGELAVSLPRLLWTRKAGRSVRDYYGRVVGGGNYAAVFGPAFDAVICQPAGDFPAASLFRRKPRRRDLPRSFTFPGGLGALAERIAGQPGLDVVTGCPAEQVRFGAGRYTVATPVGAFNAAHLGLALPPAAAARLVAGVQPALADALGRIREVAIESAAVVVARDISRLRPLAGLIGRDAPFFSVVTRDVVPAPGFRGFTFHFRPGRLDTAGKRAVIEAVLGVPAGAIRAYHEHLNTLPALGTAHAPDRLDRLLAAAPPTLAVTGNFFEGLSIGDVVARSEIAWQRLNAGEE